ncbi:hypothetical protein FRUB_09472 [Fimbriiglobus ruber]|uniref:Uncharacterized protein n=1 Tax=Fimbriiglobus ruber TaxID=1908690 RepID=A0A225D147_9BACT|nr:hypothetical protein FRUB_09472 [Fimbriiglobus ruber]
MVDVMGRPNRPVRDHRFGSRRGPEIARQRKRRRNPKPPRRDQKRRPRVLSGPNKRGGRCLVTGRNSAVGAWFYSLEARE